MSQDFLSSGMARAHGYESIFAPHAVRGRPRVFEPLQANSPFLDVLACTQTVRKMFKSWGNGDAAPSSGDIGDTAAVVIAGRKSLLTQREKGADKHFFGGGACGDSTLRRGKVCLRHWVASRVGDGGSRACHRGVPNRVNRSPLFGLLDQTRPSRGPASPPLPTSLCTHFVPAPAEAAQSLGRTAVALTRTYTRRRPTLSYTYFYDNFDVYGRDATWLPHIAAPCETRPRPTFRHAMEAIAAASRPRLGVSRAPRLRPLHERAQFGAKIGGAEREAASA